MMGRKTVTAERHKKSLDEARWKKETGSQVLAQRHTRKAGDKIILDKLRLTTTKECIRCQPGKHVQSTFMEEWQHPTSRGRQPRSVFMKTVLIKLLSNGGCMARLCVWFKVKWIDDRTVAQMICVFHAAEQCDVKIEYNCSVSQHRISGSFLAKTSVSSPWKLFILII